MLRVSDEAPVTRLVNLILLEALKKGASDIHLEPFQDKLTVRYRVDGLLYEQSSPPKNLQSSLVARLKVMGHLDIAEKRLPQDGAARVKVGERDVDIRISTIPVVEGERIVLRLLNREATVLPLRELGMSEVVYSTFQQLLWEPHGVVWVTGPTGSGKTTTLYAAIQELDTDRKNVTTIEDPVEYQLPNIGQINVKPKIGLTFSSGLRHILRQDPDVVLVGETRDLETAEIVVRSSLTGHMVFSTLHTNDAASSITRLVDMGIEAHLVAASTRASLAQRLVRKLCDNCKREYRPSSKDLALFGLSDKFFNRKKYWTADGCDACTDGYRGRTGIYELMIITPALTDAIRQGAGGQRLTELAVESGMTTMMQDGLAKVEEGMTDLPELLRIVGPSAGRAGLAGAK